MNFESLRGKYILFDTNVIINYGQYRKFYQPFIDTLFDQHIVPVVSSIIKIELYAFAKNNKERDDVEGLIMRLSKGDPKGWELPTRKELVDKAIELGQLYQVSGKKGKSIQLGDLLIGAEMMLYKEGGYLILATENHDDFPPSLFERIGIVTLDCRDSIHNVGFYKVRD
jgi:predicted nucleic acid-binding protein